MGGSEDLRNEVAAAKTSRRFADKLECALKYLPQHVAPAGAPNPIRQLYALASEGIHSESDEECIDKFDTCKAAFEYVVRKLSEAKREDEDYARSLRLLSDAKQGQQKGPAQ